MTFCYGGVKNNDVKRWEIVTVMCLRVRVRESFYEHDAVGILCVSYNEGITMVNFISKCSCYCTCSWLTWQLLP